MAKFYKKPTKIVGNDGIERTYCQCKSCGKRWQVSDTFFMPRNGYVCIKCDSGKKIVDKNAFGFPVSAGVIFLNAATV